MPLASGLPSDLWLLIWILLSSIPLVVYVYLLVVVFVPLSAEKVDPRMKSFRVWFFSWAFGAIIGCGIVFFLFVYDTLFPALDSGIKGVLSPLTLLIVLLILLSPPLKDRTTRFLGKVFGTERADK
jgi:hypothetical protein